jgi:preprotein translocase subunit SecG
MHVLVVLLTIIEVVVCLMIIGLVLIQRSKGEGISAAISGGMGESLFGAQVGNIVTRTTVVLGIIFLINTIGLTLMLTKTRGQSSGSVMDDVARQAAPAAPSAGPAAPVIPGGAAPVAPAAPAAEAPAPAAPAPAVESAAPAPAPAAPAAP